LVSGGSVHIGGDSVSVEADWSVARTTAIPKESG
jgi:hypothetical protein